MKFMNHDVNVVFYVEKKNVKYVEQIIHNV